MKKYILGAAFLFAVFVMPFSQAQASGLTNAQVQAILSILSSFGADKATIANVNTALTGGTASSPSSTAFCYNFTNDLGIGSTGNDLSALTNALGQSTAAPYGYRSSVFDEDTAAYVIAFQRSNSIRQTGYVGPLTRAKLNELYGCSTNQPTAQQIVITNVQYSPSSPRVNDWITTTVTVFNNSSINRDTPFQVNVQGTAVTVSSLGAGDRTTITVPNAFTFSYPGTQTLRTAIIYPISGSSGSGNTGNIFTNTLTFSPATETTPTPTITVTSPTANANYTIGGSPIQIGWTVTGAPANSQVVYYVTQISSTGGGSIGGGTGQTLSPLPLGSSSNSANWQTGGNNLDRPGTYEIKVEVRNCNVAGCSVAPPGATALATSNAVRVNVLSAVTSATPTTAPVITVTLNDLAYNGSAVSTTFGGTARIGWGVTPTGGTTCAAAGIGIDGGADAINLGGSWTTPALYANTTYGIKCTNSLGTTYKYVNIAVPAQTDTTTTGTTAPTITLNGNSSSSRLSINVDFGRTATFTWGVTPTTGTSCSAAGTGVNGTTGSGAIALSGSWTTPALYANTTYGIACVNRNSAGAVSGMVYKYADVTVAPQTSAVVASPSINSFTSSASSVTSGQPTNIAWNITPSGTGTTCSLSETSPTARTIYNYGEMSLSSGGTSTYNLTANTTYRIDCRNNEGWTSWKTLTIPVTTAVAPVAASCTWNGGNIGPWGVGCNVSVPSRTVSSGQTTETFQNTVSGYTGSIAFSCTNGQFAQINPTCVANVAPVSTSAPTVTLTSAASSVTSGQSTTLEWHVSPTTATCSLSATGFGTIYSDVVWKDITNWGTPSMTANTTYTLSCTNSGGTTNRSVSVAVNTIATSVGCSADGARFKNGTTREAGGVRSQCSSTDYSWQSPSYLGSGTYPAGYCAYGSYNYSNDTLGAVGQQCYNCSGGAWTPISSSYCGNLISSLSLSSQTASALNAFNSVTNNAGVPQNTSGFSYTFTQDMYRGVQGSEVIALQRALNAEGLFAGEATGNFYDVTREAVIAFQIKYGINPTGYVGAETRAKLNALY
ncbi:peptidoglycan-binding protein [Candidatus Kaiserbacteria bacterium]|nr:peptidoglycan-binding protein [Candidatus Kaiserbacteria bacterium]